MSEIKWVKLRTDMFDDEKIVVIESLPDAATIILIWVRLICQAGKCNEGGSIQLSETIPYTDETLAKIFHCEVNTIRLALSTFDKMGMIEWENGKYLKLVNWEKHQNIEGLERVRQLTRERVQKHRQRYSNVTDSEEQLQLNANSQIDSGNVTQRYGNATEQDNRQQTTDKETEQETDKELLLLGKSDFSDVLLFYENNVEKVDEIKREFIIAACEKYSIPWVTDAILEVTKNKKVKHSWEYILGILKNYEIDGHKTKATQDKFSPSLPPDMLTPDCSIEKAIRIVEGNLEALPANRRRFAAELTKHGISFKSTEGVTDVPAET